MDCRGALAGTLSVSFFVGALFASVRLLHRGFRLRFLLVGELAWFGFEILMGAGAGTGGTNVGGIDLGLGGKGGRITREALVLDAGGRSWRLLVRCLKRVFNLAWSVPKYCRCHPVMAPTILAGSASSFEIMSLTDVDAEKISRLTRSACEALIHLERVIVVTNHKR